MRSALQRLHGRADSKIGGQTPTEPAGLLHFEQLHIAISSMLRRFLVARPGHLSAHLVPPSQPRASAVCGGATAAVEGRRRGNEPPAQARERLVGMKIGCWHVPRAEGEGPALLECKEESRLKASVGRQHSCDWSRSEESDCELLLRPVLASAVFLKPPGGAMQKIRRVSPVAMVPQGPNALIARLSKLV